MTKYRLVGSDYVEEPPQRRRTDKLLWVDLFPSERADEDFVRKWVGTNPKHSLTKERMKYLFTYGCPRAVPLQYTASLVHDDYTPLKWLRCPNVIQANGWCKGHDPERQAARKRAR